MDQEHMDAEGKVISMKTKSNTFEKVKVNQFKKFY